MSDDFRNMGVRDALEILRITLERALPTVKWTLKAKHRIGDGHIWGIVAISAEVATDGSQAPPSVLKKAAAHQEWLSRVKASQAAEDRKAALKDDLMEQVIEAGFNAMAKKLHPDVGGSVEQMAKLNDLRSKIRNGRTL